MTEQEVDLALIVNGALHRVRVPASSCLRLAASAEGHEITTVTTLLEQTSDPAEKEDREATSGNLCRHTGYQNIMASVLRASELSREISGEARS